MIKNFEKNLKKNSGVTLVALAITIVVLVILASISIAKISGEDGIINKAKESKRSTEKTAIIEQIQTEVIANMGTNNELNQQKLEEKLKKEIPNISFSGNVISDNKVIVTVDTYEIKMEIDIERQYYNLLIF